MNGKDEAIQIKLVIVGDGSVGKTCILVSYTTDKFPSVYVPTVFENYSAQIKVDDKMINLALWDTAGQEEYNKLRQISYPQSDVFIITFAVDDPPTFKNAVQKVKISHYLKWYPELQAQMPHVPKIFVGNKIDMRKSDDENKYIQSSIAQSVIEELQCKYMECSALTQQNLKIVFEEAIRVALKNIAGTKPRSSKLIDTSMKPKPKRSVESKNHDVSGQDCEIM